MNEDCGVKITGYLAAMEEKQGEYDGIRKVTYRYLLVVGMDSYLVTSDNDYRGCMMIQDKVTFAVMPWVYSGKVFYSRGKLLV